MDTLTPLDERTTKALHYALDNNRTLSPGDFERVVEGAVVTLRATNPRFKGYTIPVDYPGMDDAGHKCPYDPQKAYLNGDISHLLTQWPDLMPPEGWVPVEYIVSCCCGNSAHASLVTEDYLTLVEVTGALLGDDCNGHGSFSDTMLWEQMDPREYRCCCSSILWTIDGQDPIGEICLYQRLDSQIEVDFQDMGQDDQENTWVCADYDEALAKVAELKGVLEERYPGSWLLEQNAATAPFPAALGGALTLPEEPEDRNKDQISEALASTVDPAAKAVSAILDPTAPAIIYESETLIVVED
jgi:hypothetical protein